MINKERFKNKVLDHLEDRFFVYGLENVYVDCISEYGNEVHILINCWFMDSSNGEMKQFQENPFMFIFRYDDELNKVKRNIDRFLIGGIVKLKRKLQSKGLRFADRVEGTNIKQCVAQPMDYTIRIPGACGTGGK